MWLVDITTELPDSRRLALEYDGAFWHADKSELDTEKSLDLLAAGYLVARLREHPLGPLFGARRPIRRIHRSFDRAGPGGDDRTGEVVGGNCPIRLNRTGGIQFARASSLTGRTTTQDQFLGPP